MKKSAWIVLSSIFGFMLFYKLILVINGQFFVGPEWLENSIIIITGSALLAGLVSMLARRFIERFDKWFAGVIAGMAVSMATYWAYMGWLGLIYADLSLSGKIMQEMRSVDEPHLYGLIAFFVFETVFFMCRNWPAVYVVNGNLEEDELFIDFDGDGKTELFRLTESNPGLDNLRFLRRYECDGHRDDFSLFCVKNIELDFQEDDVCLVVYDKNPIGYFYAKKIGDKQKVILEFYYASEKADAPLIFKEAFEMYLSENRGCDFAFSSMERYPQSLRDTAELIVREWTCYTYESCGTEEENGYISYFIRFRT